LEAWALRVSCPSICPDSIRAGQGEMTVTHDRFAYTLPEAAGMESKTLEEIRSIAQEGIDNKAYPGCRVWWQDGKVVYDRSFGYSHTTIRLR